MKHANRTRRFTTAAVAATVAGLFLAGIGVTLPTGAAPPAPTAPAQPALDWLAGQLAANGGSMPGFTPGSSDWGLTADTILAFAAAGQTANPAAQTATDLLDLNSAVATTWENDGTTVREAGPTAKVLLALRSMGRSAVSQGVDLDAALRGLMVSSGVQAGRFSDGGIPDPTWNSANGFSQSIAMLALAMGAEGIPGQAVTFQIAQQCPSGGFRLSYGTTAACTDDAQVDTDASAVAVMALLAVEPRTPLVTTALDKGLTWLVERQAADGSFGGTGPTATANTNSTGLISQALRAAGASDRADAGATWIAACCQLTPANATGSPTAGDIGALAANPAALSTALTGGIGTQTGDQWRRTTAQAVLAFGLAPYGPQDVEPLPTTTTTTTTTSSSTTTTSTTTLPDTTLPDTTLPDITTTTVVGVPAPSVDSAQLEQSGGTGGSAPSAASTGLASTGGDPTTLLAISVALVALGAVLGSPGRWRRR